MNRWFTTADEDKRAHRKVSTDVEWWTGVETRKEFDSRACRNHRLLRSESRKGEEEHAREKIYKSGAKLT